MIRRKKCGIVVCNFYLEKCLIVLILFEKKIIIIMFISFFFYNIGVKKN